ncbi:MAG: tripartite tricarboxylate transporter substrate binding protein [Betaproteobacteria bacterium]|nr:tripartite tricarboxylate transporter substrate binding protein [Betaproteobacteria bacterium]
MTVPNLTRATARALAVSALVVASAVHAAQPAYPTKPIRLVLPFPPGGGTDALARIFTPRLTESLGQTIVIDNRSGAAGNIANEIVARAAPDGYTLLMGFSTTLTVNPLLYKLSFDVHKDLAPITQLATAQYFLVLHPSVPAKSLKEFIALAKEKPGQLNYSSSGVGSPLHLAAELFKQRAGINIVHVAYKGGGPAGAAVLAGEVQVLFGSVASTFPQVKAGRLRALAVTSDKRSRLMPELPTIAESGFPGFNVTAWDSVLAPGRTPQPVLAKLNAEIVKVVKLPEVREAFLRVGYDPTATSARELAGIIKAETALWAKVIKEANIRAE